MENQYDAATAMPQENMTGEPAMQPQEQASPYGFDYVGGIDANLGYDYDLSQYGAAPYDGYGDAEYYAQQEQKPIRSSEELLDFFKERAAKKRYANPVLVLALMLIFFPAGLFAMYFYTKWGAYAKIMITLFVLAAVLAFYEIIVAKQIVELPSVIETVGYIYDQYFG